MLINALIPSTPEDAVEFLFASLPIFSVDHEGADPTGVADSSAAVTAAIAAAKATGFGGVVNWGLGVYKFANCLAEPGVYHKGRGSCHAPLGTSGTKWVPATTAAGTRFLGLSPTCGEDFDGGGISGIEIDGTLYIGAATIPSAPTSTVETAKIRGIDLRQGPLKTISAVDTSTEVITTSAPHSFNNGDLIGFDVASGGVLPGNIPGNPAYRYAGAVTSLTFCAYDTQANALAGGATGKVNISSAGSGTRYVYRSIHGVNGFAIEHCYFHNLDEAVRLSSIVDRSMCLYTVFKYCYTGFQGQEHPRFLNCRFQHCIMGLTGRFVDMILNGSNQFAACWYGVCPYDPVGAGGSSYIGNSNGTYSINNCKISGEYYQCVVAITVNTGNSVLPETYVVGATTDSGTLTYSKSIGVRVQGTENDIAGRYGEGGAATSFAVAAILIDTNGAGSDGANNSILGANFNLVSAVTGNAAIAGGNSNANPPVTGSGSYGAFTKVTVRGCSARLGNMRFLYFSSANGSLQDWEIDGNTVRVYSGGTNTMGASAGVLEAPFYNGCEIFGNKIHNVGGTAGSAIKQSSNLVMTGTRVILNRMDRGTWSVAGIDNSSGTPSNTTIWRNAGYVTEFAGTATLNGTSNVNVPHGMAVTPPIAYVILTAQGDVGAVTPQVVSTDATNIVIKASGASTGTVNVRASYSP